MNLTQIFRPLIIQVYSTGMAWFCKHRQIRDRPRIYYEVAKLLCIVLLLRDACNINFRTLRGGNQWFTVKDTHVFLTRYNVLFCF